MYGCLLELADSVHDYSDRKGNLITTRNTNLSGMILTKIAIPIFKLEAEPKHWQSRVMETKCCGQPLGTAESIKWGPDALSSRPLASNYNW